MKKLTTIICITFICICAVFAHNSLAVCAGDELSISRADDDAMLYAGALVKLNIEGNAGKEVTVYHNNIPLQDDTTDGSVLITLSEGNNVVWVQTSDGSEVSDCINIMAQPLVHRRSFVNATMEENSRGGISKDKAGGVCDYVDDEDSEHGKVIKLSWFSDSQKSAPYFILPNTTAYKGICIYEFDYKISGPDINYNIVSIKTNLNGWTSFGQVSTNGYLMLDGEETDFKIEKDTWHNYKLVFDFSNMTFSVYADSQFVGSGLRSGFETFQYVNFSIPKSGDTSIEVAVYLDNIKMDYYASNYSYELYTVAVGEEQEGLSDFPMEGGSVKIVFSEEVTFEHGKTVVFTSDGLPVACDVSADKTVITITPKGKLAPRAKCVIDVASVVTLYGGKSAKGSLIEFTVVPSGFVISSCDVALNDDICVSLEIKNTTDAKCKGVVICVLSRSNKILSASSGVAEVAGGDVKSMAMNLVVPDDYNPDTDMLSVYLADDKTFYATDKLENIS